MANNDNVHFLITREQAKSPIAEAYRTFRTNLQFCKVDGSLKSLLFTSSGPGEGKSSTVANTAIALALTGKKVIIVDCDMRKPVQHRMFCRKQTGLTNFLVGKESMENIIQDTEVENLRLVASGPTPPNPSELLDSDKMREFLGFLKGKADYILFDTPPVLPVTDACVLTSQVDGTILVIRSGQVKPEIALRAKTLLVKAGGHLLGVILNGSAEQMESNYYEYYGVSVTQSIARGT